ncbi:serine hydrolase domain-containing protein [Saccharicrinis sp. FJH54]|uniref:serine hydrolase domain-containing protein n=1 Tax=Saccharicrinis sp. FJH54 TaxID=3344665 RepID=UPI0035D40980
MIKKRSVKLFSYEERIFFIFLLLHYSFYSGIAQKTNSCSLINKFENQLANDVKDDQVGSISASIILDNKTVWSKAFGYADPMKQFDADTSTLYRVASVSKTFTVLLMMKMIEEGYFKLDDPVDIFVPEIKKIRGYSESNRITFKQLASHTSGLDREPKLRNADLGQPEFWENQTILSIPTIKLISEPGLKYNYSNIGISIIGLAISRAAKKPFIDLIVDKILIPLNMKNTFYRVPEKERNKMSIGVYGSRLTKRNIKIANRELQGRGYKVPAAGLITTSTDLTRFVISLMGRSESKILSNESLKLMQTPVIQIDSGVYYGLGLFITKNENHIIIGHGGTTRGFCSLFAFDPTNNNGVVLLRNYNKGKMNFDTSATLLLNELAFK